LFGSAGVSFSANLLERIVGHDDTQASDDARPARHMTRAVARPSDSQSVPQRRLSAAHHSRALAVEGLALRKAEDSFICCIAEPLRRWLMMTTLARRGWPLAPGII
jgi:hypothetical protein